MLGLEISRRRVNEREISIHIGLQLNYSHRPGNPNPVDSGPSWPQILNFANTIAPLNPLDTPALGWRSPCAPFIVEIWHPRSFFKQSASSCPVCQKHVAMSVRVHDRMLCVRWLCAQATASATVTVAHIASATVFAPIASGRPSWRLRQCYSCGFGCASAAAAHRLRLRIGCGCVLAAAAASAVAALRVMLRIGCTAA
jgi:hypothetical protein